jgi:ribonuclease Z
MFPEAIHRASLGLRRERVPFRLELGLFSSKARKPIKDGDFVRLGHIPIQKQERIPPLSHQSSVSRRNSAVTTDTDPYRFASLVGNHGKIPAISVKAKFPTGILRDTRFGEAESGEMEMTFLGTASCIPTITRGVSSLAFRYNRDIWLFDCGESTQRQLQNSKIRPSRVRKIFLSHTHGDHCFGLPGVLCMLGQSTIDERERVQAEGEAPAIVDIYGPEGVRDFVRATMQLTYSRVTAPYRVHELKNVPWLHSKGNSNKNQQQISIINTTFDSQYGEREGGKDIFPDENGIYSISDDNNIVVQAAPMQHTVPCVGFVVTENNRPGSLRVDLVSQLVQQNKNELKRLPENEGDYMKTFRILKDLGQKESFTFPNGVTVHGEDINEPTKRGRKIVIMGDTCSGRMIKNIAMNADVLVHEATNAFLPEYDSSSKYKTYAHLERDSFYHGHSTPQMAGKFAAEIGAKKLILTHFSPRYLGDASESSMKTMWLIEDMARSTSNLMRTNGVIAAWDYLTLPIPLELCNV